MASASAGRYGLAIGRGAYWKDRTTRSCSVSSLACTQPRLTVQIRWPGVHRSREPSENLSSTISYAVFCLKKKNKPGAQVLKSPVVCDPPRMDGVHTSPPTHPHHSS